MAWRRLKLRKYTLLPSSQWLLSAACKLLSPFSQNSFLLIGIMTPRIQIPSGLFICAAKIIGFLGFLWLIFSEWGRVTYIICDESAYDSEDRAQYLRMRMRIYFFNRLQTYQSYNYPSPWMFTWGERRTFLIKCTCSSEGPTLSAWSYGFSVEENKIPSPVSPHRAL